MTNIISKGTPLAIQKEKILDLINAQKNPNQDAIRAILNYEESDDGWMNYFDHRYSYAVSIEGVAIIKIEGPLFRYENWLCYFGGGMSFDGLSYAVRKAEQDHRVKSILFYINSPGGEVDGTGEFATQIKNCSKPTASYVSNLCASAAYWIASATGRITAFETGIIGSIGVMCILYDFSRLLESEGIDEYMFVSSVSPYKVLDPSKDEEATLIKALIDDLGNKFVSKIAEYRGTTEDNVKENFGKGDVMISSKALEAGMIDAIGTFPMAISGMQSLTSNGEKPVAKEEDQKETDMSEKSEDDKEKKTSKKSEDDEELDAECDDMEEEAKALYSKNKTAASKLISFAAASERNRQKDIDEVQASYPGQKVLISKLRYETTLSAAEISYKAMQADKKGKQNKKADLDEDGAEVASAELQSQDTGKDFQAKQVANLSEHIKTLRGKRNG